MSGSIPKGQPRRASQPLPFPVSCDPCALRAKTRSLRGRRGGAADPATRARASTSNRRFAENVGLRFFTPEEVFCDTWEVLATLPQGAEAAAEGAAAPVAETVEATAAVAVVVTGEEGAAAAGGAVLVDEAVVVVEAAAAGGEAEGGSA